MPTQCIVIRNGQRQPVDAKYIVVGDLVVLEEGGRVPADCRVLESNNLHVDRSSLNGESVAFALHSEPNVEQDVEALESHCLAFNGSPITEGQGVGVVMRTADHTYIGHLAQLTNSTRHGETTFEHEVRAFVRVITILAITMAAIFFGIGLGRRDGHGAVDILVNGFLVIIVANVPQGIPATVTSLLTVAARCVEPLDSDNPFF